MDHGWVIDLLPTRGLDQSILIAVLIGMWVLLAFTEIFGWVFIGVVVPGYLASVLVISPTTAVAIILEALVSLFFSRILAQALNQTGAWTHFFGRDRFFLIVLVSVFVRQFDQTWLIPELTIYLRNQGWANLDLGTDFSSIGLVLVPLAANMFWKLNALRGLVQITTVVGLTYALLRWGLLPFTNLSYSSFELTYENSAIDFVANGKAYIIMLCTAYVAGVVNLRYGWDFGGILVAALLALLWPTPTKLALTIVESMVLLTAMKHFVRLPVIRNLNLEGPRKVCTVFSLAFLIKWSISFLIGDRFPGLKITDLFAFGYLMSSLLAVRMLQKKSVRLVLLPALTTSVLGYFVGSVLGFFAQELIHDDNGVKPPGEANIVSRRLLRSPAGVAAYATARFSVERPRDSAEPAFLRHAPTDIWPGLSTWLTLSRPLMSDSVLHSLAAAKFAWITLEHKFEHASRSYLVFAGERADGTNYRGPLVVLNAQSSGPVVIVQDTRSKIGMAEHAVGLCTTLRCRALIFLDQRHSDITDESTAQDDNKEVVRAFAQHHSVWLLLADARVPLDKPILHLSTAVTDSAPFAISNFSLDWTLPEELQSWSNMGVDRLLRVHPDAFWHQPWHTNESVNFETSPQSASAFVDDLTVATRATQDQRETFRTQNVGASVRLPSYSATELRLLGRLIVGTLLQEVGQGNTRRPILARIARWGALLDLRLTHLPHCEATYDCMALTNSTPENGLLLMVRHGDSGPLDLEVPRPRAEFGTLGLASAAWSALRARALLIDLAPIEDDPTRIGAVYTAFQAIHQELDRSIYLRHGQTASAIVQIRGFTDHEAPGIGGIVGVGTPLIDRRQIPSALYEWIGPGSPLPSVQDIRLSDGAPDILRFSAGAVPQLAYSRWLGQKDAFTMWFSSTIREFYRPRVANLWASIDMLRKPLAQQRLVQGIRLASPLASLNVRANLAPFVPSLPMSRNIENLAQQVDEPTFLNPHTQVNPSHHASSGTSPGFVEALDHAYVLARYGHPQAIHALESWSETGLGRTFGLAHGLYSGLEWLWLEERTTHSCVRALVLLGEAREELSWISGHAQGMTGPFLSADQAFFGRSRTLLAACEPVPP